MRRSCGGRAQAAAPRTRGRSTARFGGRAAPRRLVIGSAAPLRPGGGRCGTTFEFYGRRWPSLIALRWGCAAAALVVQCNHCRAIAVAQMMLFAGSNCRSTLSQRNEAYKEGKNSANASAAASLPALCLLLLLLLVSYMPLAKLMRLAVFAFSGGYNRYECLRTRQFVKSVRRAAR